MLDGALYRLGETRKVGFMTRNRFRPASIRRRTLVVVVAVMAPLATLGGAAPALAVEHHPKGIYAPFADCPLANTSVENCVFAQTKSGEFIVGTKTVPIVNTITLQGGFSGIESSIKFIGAEDGKTLSKTPQPVPGGLLGVVAPSFLPKFLQELFNEFINKGITGVTATTELAAPASSIGLNTENTLNEEGIALSLPVKIKLDNPFLGTSCYIGSNAHPVVIEFTTGTTSPPEPNEPISGKAGTFEEEDSFQLIRLKNNTLVNNSFAAPGAEGCGGILSFLVDPAVNAEVGIPAEEGHNTAILNSTLEVANATTVKASE
jgi:hypothetical protein